MDGSGTGVLDLGMSILGSLETVETGQEEQMELSLTVPVVGMDPVPIQMAEILIDGKVHLVEIQSSLRKYKLHHDDHHVALVNQMSPHA